MKWINVIFSLIITSSGFVSGKYSPSTPNVLFFEPGRGFSVGINNEGISYFEVRYMNAGKSNHWLIDGRIIYPYESWMGKMFFVNFYEKFEIGDVLIYSIHVTHEDVPQKVQYYMKSVTKYEDSITATRLRSMVEMTFRFFTTGFKLTHTHYNETMNIYLQLNRKVNIKTAADVVITGIKLRGYDAYIYKNNSYWFEKGDKLCISIDFRYQGYYKPFVQEITTYNGNPHCSIGVTTFGDRDKICICRRFYKPLNLSVWIFERKYGFDPDFEFVLYSNQRTKIKEGILQITPTDFSYNDQKYEIQNCTGVPNSQECVYDRRRNRDVIAPILSSKLTTKNSFNFKYGRVEVRAKLPTADWTVPFIMLEPKESKYQRDNYKSGQIHIVSFANNPTINSTVNQGPRLGAKEPLRSIFMTKRSFDSEWYSQYHTFAVEWRPNWITTFIDGEPQVTEDWRKSHLIIPESEASNNYDGSVASFDKEFYISIGVSVGGINDFQSGTPWDLRSPLQKRQFKNSPEWRNSWDNGRNMLKVDYVKVIAI